MKINDFMFLCEQYNIDPVLASEDEGVRKILKTPTSDVKQQLMLSGYLHKNF
jgi:hypothetical protein